MAFVFGTGFEEGAIIAGIVIGTGTVKAGSKLPTWAGAANSHTGVCCWESTTTNGYRIDVSPTLSEFYVSVWWRGDAGGSGAIFHWKDDAGNIMGSVRSTAANVLAAYTGSATLAATGTKTVQNSLWHLIEIHVKIADAGNIDTKVDGQADIAYSGDTKPAAATAATTIGVGSDGNTFGIGTFDDFTVNDTTGGVEDSYPGDVRYVPVYPTGNGTTSGLTGSDGNQVNNYQLADDLATGNNDGDTTYNKATAADQYDTYATTDPTLQDGTVLRLIVKAVARKTNAALATTARLELRDSGGTNRDSGSDLTLSGSYGVITGIWDTDPNTGVAWDGAGLNGAELLGFKGTGAFS